MDQAQTIFALSTALGRAGIAVVRMSGYQAGAALDALSSPRPLSRTGALRKGRNPAT